MRQHKTERYGRYHELIRGFDEPSRFDARRELYAPVAASGLTRSITSPIVSVNRTGLCGVLAVYARERDEIKMM